MAEITRRDNHQRRITKGKVVAVLFALAFIALVVWLVLDIRGIKSIHTVSEPLKAPLPDSSLTPSPGADFTTYTNNKIGFSVAFPDTILSSHGSQCGTSDVMPDGTKDPAANGFQPTPGPQRATIIDGGNGLFYLTEASTFQPGGSATDASKHAFYSTCDVIASSTDRVQALEDGNLTYQFTVIPVSVTTANSEADITKTMGRIYRNSTVAIASMTPDSSGKWQDVTLDCQDSVPCKNGSIKQYLRYYETQHKFMYMALGKAPLFEAPDGKSFYDQQILDSFKLTK